LDNGYSETGLRARIAYWSRFCAFKKS